MDGDTAPVWVREERVKQTPPEQPRHPCAAYNGNRIVRTVCERTSKEPEANTLYCVGHNCQSPWRVHKARSAPPALRAPRMVPTKPPPAPVAPAPRPPIEVVRAQPAEAGLASNIEVVGRIILVPVEQVAPMEGQPRLIFDELEMELMAASLRESGQIIPALLVEVSGRPGITHQIVDGERRYRGVIAAGLPKLKGIVYDGLGADDARRLYRMSVVANFGRVEHSPLERALAAKSFMDDLGITIVEVARQFSKSRETIENDLRLLRLDPQVHALMLNGLPGKGLLGSGVASRLYAYPADFQAMVAREIVEMGIDSHKAAYHIRRRVSEERVSRLAGTRGKSPADTSMLFLRGLATFGGKLERLTTVADMPLSTVFGGMKTPNRTKLRSIVDALELNLAKIREALKNTE